MDNRQRLMQVLMQRGSPMMGRAMALPAVQQAMQQQGGMAPDQTRTPMQSPAPTQVYSTGPDYSTAPTQTAVNRVPPMAQQQTPASLAPFQGGGMAPGAMGTVMQLPQVQQAMQRQSAMTAPQMPAAPSRIPGGPRLGGMK